MKKLICISLALLCYFSIANAQGQNKNNNLNHKKIKDFAISSKKQHFDIKTLREGNYLTQNPKTKSLIWRPDTIVTYDTLNNLFERLTRIYDVHGNCLVELMQQWTNNDWENVIRFTYTYDLNGNESTMLFEICDTNMWVNDTKVTRTFDANGNMTLAIVEFWDVNAWVNAMKGIITYDSHGNELTAITQQWDTNVWVNSDRETSTYNSNNNKLTYLDEVWQTNAWENSSKDTYTYDASGNLLTDIFQDWQTNAWENAGRDTYTYDINGNELTELYEQWHTNTWENSNKATFTYNTHGNPLTEVYEDWQPTLKDHINIKAWDISRQVTYTYDSNENILNVLIESWQNYKEMSTIKFSFTYDTNGNSLTGKCEKLNSTNWLPEMGFLPIYAAKEALFEVTAYRYQASFKSFNTKIAEFNANKSLYIYPNPATNNITVNYTSLNENKGSMIAIYNIQGQLLQQVPLQQENQQIDISALSKGVYLLKLNNSPNTAVVKIVKE